MNKETQLPAIIYKYRNFENPEERRMLTDNEIYLASPDEFIKKGSIDCDFEIKYPKISHAELINFYIASYQALPTEETIKNAIKYANNPPYYNNSNRLSAERILKKKINESLGIFCVSDTWNNIELWKKPFGGDGKGFCVGFNSEKLVEYLKFKDYDKLDYYDKTEKPILTFDPYNKYSREEVHKFIMSLPVNFHKENEYRLYKQSINNESLLRKYILPNEIISEVIFGELFDVNKNMEIIVQLKTKGIKVFQAKFDFTLNDLCKIKIH